MEEKIEQKARRKEAVILRLMRGEKLPEVLKDYPDMKLSPATWSRLKKRYGRGGFEALIDHRKGLPYKLNPEIREFVLATKGSDPNLSSKELVDQVKEKYGLILSKSSINQILRKAGMSGRVGRRPGRVAAKVKAVPEEAEVLPEEAKPPLKEAEIPAEEAEAPAEKGEAPPEAPPEEVRVLPEEVKILPMECAGCFFLKGADCDILGSYTITRVVKEAIAKPLQSMNELLLYLPLFGVKRPEALDPPKEKSLSFLIESDKVFSSNEISRYLKEVESFKLSPPLNEELARCYSEALAIKVELEDGASFCIDGHLKTVWPDEKISQQFSTLLNKIKSYINRFFLNGSINDPLILSVCPGYINVSSELFDLIEAFEGRKAIKGLSIIGPDGSKIEAVKGIRLTKRFFIAYLSPWQYKGLEDFRIKKGFIDWQTDLYPGRPRVADAEISLIDRTTGRDISIRTILIQEEGKPKAIITNITSQEEPEMRKIALAYFSRWPDHRGRTFYDVMQEGLKKSELSVSERLGPSSQEEPSLLDLFRLLLENLNRYAQSQYFYPKYEGVSIDKMAETFYKQRGYVKKGEDFITVTLERYDDPELQKNVEYACRRFSEGDIRTPGGKRISIYLKTP